MFANLWVSLSSGDMGWNYFVIVSQYAVRYMAYYRNMFFVCPRILKLQNNGTKSIQRRSGESRCAIEPSTEHTKNEKYDNVMREWVNMKCECEIESVQVER